MLDLIITASRLITSGKNSKLTLNLSQFLDLAFSILFARKRKDFKSASIAIALIGLLFIQVMLGMLTVTEKLKPLIVLSHLLTGLSLLSVLWWTYLDLHLREDTHFKHNDRPRVLPWIWPAFFLVVAQITLGGWVSTHSAGLACIDFPYCNGKLLPTMQWNKMNSDLITIHMLHRMGALITASYLTFLALFLFRHSLFREIAIIIFAFVTLQITLGILNIIWLRPVWIALIHQAVAILLLLTVITSLVKASIISGDRHAFRTA